MDWRGRATEREVKLQLFGAPRNPYHGLVWSSDRTRGKVVTFLNFYASRATLTMDWRGRATEREVKLQLFGAPFATLTMDWCGRATEREVKLQLLGTKPSREVHSHDKHSNIKSSTCKV